RAGPLHDRSPVPIGVRHEPRPVPDAAPPGAGARRDRERAVTGAGRGRDRVRRPEPHDAAVQAHLRYDAGALDGPHGRAPLTAEMCDPTAASSNSVSPLLPAARPRIVGIVNITEDSFSDGGLYLDAEAAIAHAWRLRAQGADVIELGPASSH